MTTRVRPFTRSDRDQLTTLVNAHLSAVTPGASVSVQGLLSQLERDPGEFIVDPWVSERVTLVAEQRSRVVAAAHLLRYRDDADVGSTFRGTAEIHWLVCWTPAPFWPDAAEAGAALMAGCLAQLDRWQVRRCYADGSLPGPGVYGVPEQWPHILELYEQSGFSGGRTETVLIAAVDRLVADLPRPPLALRTTRTLGINGTRFTAYDDVVAAAPVEVGYLEVDTNLGEAGRFSRGAGWADIGNLQVAEPYRRRGVATWLLGHATDWLALGGIGQLLAYVDPEDGEAERAFYPAVGFDTLTRTRRMLQQDR
ncbi:MAG: GNAT family N-acetyltransferase [Propionibacteriaceae bacterium]